MSRIKLITLEYPPQHGGVGVYLKGEVIDASDEVEVVRAEEYFWCKWPAWLPILWRVKRPARLWVSHVLPIGYVALVWKKLYKTKYRVYLHGLDLVRPRRSAWKSFWVAKILRNADELVVNSLATAKLLKSYGLDPARARVRYPRVSPPLPEGTPPESPPLPAAAEGLGGRESWQDHYAKLGKSLRKKYDLADKPVLLTVSRLVKRKGIDLVLKALPEVWRAIPDLVYVIVGEGEEREDLAQLKTVILNEAWRSEESRDSTPRSFGLPQDDVIILLGAVSDEEKYAWLSACDCFILTPRETADDFEGYGIVYKEAQIFGKPVIGSKTGGVPEAVGANGVLVEPGNVRAISKSIIDILENFQTPISNNQIPRCHSDPPRRTYPRPVAIAFIVELYMK